MKSPEEFDRFSETIIFVSCVLTAILLAALAIAWVVKKYWV